MNIFEDDEDRSEFLRIFADSLRAHRVALYAWCLMSNHLHVLVRGSIEDVSSTMRISLGSYARFFNLKHGHVGHLFQNRFSSTPVEDDSQFIAALRYIHLNPVHANLSEIGAYPWSSYGEYIGNSIFTDTSFALDMLGSVKAFEKIHEEAGSDKVGQSPSSEGRFGGAVVSEVLAKAVAEEASEGVPLAELKALEKGRRDEIIIEMRKRGLSVRQIERITGIGRGIVQRARLDGSAR